MTLKFVYASVNELQSVFVNTKKLLIAISRSGLSSYSDYQTREIPEALPSRN